MEWKKLDLSAAEVEQIRLMVPIFVIFRHSGVGSSGDHQKPLQLLNSLQTATMETDRTAIMQRLSASTVCHIRKHEGEIRKRYDRMMAQCGTDHNVRLEALPDFETLRPHIRHLHHAFRLMNEFLDTYPISASPPTQQALARTQTPPTDPRSCDTSRHPTERTVNDRIVMDTKNKSSSYFYVIARNFH
jgi:hypothetical protein